MNEIIFKIEELRAEQKMREQALENLREQICRDEEKLQELDKTIEEIRQDINDIKQMIEDLRQKFTP